MKFNANWEKGTKTEIYLWSNRYVDGCVTTKRDQSDLKINNNSKFIAIKTRRICLFWKLIREVHWWLYSLIWVPYLFSLIPWRIVHVIRDIKDRHSTCWHFHWFGVKSVREGKKPNSRKRQWVLKLKLIRADHQINIFEWRRSQMPTIWWYSFRIWYARIG